jgi:hypothetical protein
MSDIRPTSTTALPQTLHDWLRWPLVDAASAQLMFQGLQGLARQQGVTLRQPPTEPTTCCGRGCNGCVWEGYFEATVYWRDEAGLLLEDGPPP